MKKTKRPTNVFDPANSDLPFDPEVLSRTDGIQVIGDPLKAMSGTEPTFRRLTLDDIEDDCPICQANRARIIAGDPPMVYVYE